MRLLKENTDNIKGDIRRLLKYIENEDYIRVLDRFLNTQLLTMTLEERKTYFENQILTNEQSTWIALLVEVKFILHIVKSKIKLYADEHVIFDTLLNIDKYCEVVWIDAEYKL